MKFKLSNGHAIYLWENEFTRIEIDETQFSYLKPDGKKVTIRLPRTWLAGCIESNNEGENIKILAKKSHGHSDSQEKTVLDQFQNVIGPKNKETVELSTQFQRLKDDIQKFQDQIQNKFNLINRFETINSQNEKKLCQLQQENLKISQVNNTIQKDLTSLKSVCDNLINSVEGLGSEIDSFYPPIDALLDCVRPPKLSSHHQSQRPRKRQR